MILDSDGASAIPDHSLLSRPSSPERALALGKPRIRDHDGNIGRLSSLLLAGTFSLVIYSGAAAQTATDLNLQSRIQTYTPPLQAAQPSPLGRIDGVRFISENKCRSKNDPAVIHEALRQRRKSDPTAPETFYEIHPEKLVPDFTESQRQAIFGRKNNKFLSQIPPPNLACRTEQPTNVTLSVPLNPTWESNVLKSNTNNSSGSSIGFGGSVTVTTAGMKDRPFDLIAYSVSSASARYTDFPSKSFDSVTEQAAYQVFLGAFNYVNGQPRWIGPKTDNIPSPNLITLDTLSVGFQNQTAFLPGFHAKTVDLFTPQVTIGRQNISIFGAAEDNKCGSTTPGVQGFCHYLDLSLTAGQTLSDLVTQQNSNVTLAATPGWRINSTDWKVTLPATVTARYYNDVPGGRRDALFQIGSAVSYSRITAGDPTSFSFSLAVTYNQNYSTVSAAAWHGIVVQPTLTIAFNPPIPTK